MYIAPHQTLGSELIVTLDEKNLKYFRNKILPLEIEGVKERRFLLSFNGGKATFHKHLNYLLWN